MRVASKRRNVTSEDLPATQGMLNLVRSELQAESQESRAERRAQFKQLDSQFLRLDSKILGLDAKIERVVEAVHHVAGEVARVGLLVEEQNSRNRVVLEGLTGLFDRQEKVERRTDHMEKLLNTLARSKG